MLVIIITINQYDPEMIISEYLSFPTHKMNTFLECFFIELISDFSEMIFVKSFWRL